MHAMAKIGKLGQIRMDSEEFAVAAILYFRTGAYYKVR